MRLSQMMMGIAAAGSIMIACDEKDNSVECRFRTKNTEYREYCSNPCRSEKIVKYSKKMPLPDAAAKAKEECDEQLYKVFERYITE